jgi:hypothetical protein
MMLLSVGGFGTWACGAVSPGTGGSGIGLSGLRGSRQVDVHQGQSKEIVDELGLLCSPG